MTRIDARGELLDAAERLFAQEGIATVSDRRVAEVAGNTNHSAVRYYFEGRTGLLQALVQRHHDAVEPRRRELLEGSDSLLDDLRALILPLTEVLAALPVPSWRARFFDQAQHDPATVEIIGESTHDGSAAAEIFRSIIDRLSHLDHEVVMDRARLMTHIIGSACADLEARAESAVDPDAWTRAGDFLCDAIAGMLQAPISVRPSTS